ncbi:hypothetical protein ASZ78_004736 [Callipepla squamata]|uniref:Immunoglobulin I-set domain-containing protein n=1 Tax=Callipepla squamata TaxID=9009 RepID=A0A226MNH2_CALSU|nr:hypothetical protein ASZ78_004736 [Callipepla squamata]
MQSPSGSLTGSPYGITPVFTKYSSMPEFVISEEVCTLVITEAFPEDSGIFKCVAENEFGSAASSARLSVSPGAKELDSFAGAAHMPAVQISMKKPGFARSSQAAAKDRDVASLPSYNTDTPGLGNRAEASNFVQLNSKSEAEDFHGGYENAPQNSSLSNNQGRAPSLSAFHQKEMKEISTQSTPACRFCPQMQAYRSNFAFSSCVSSYSKPMYKKQASINSMQKTSDHEIRGTKEALIQDLEKKLRCKDSLLQNGNQNSSMLCSKRLTYEERMARRLLGPENAASVFEAQSEDMQNAQVKGSLSQEG